MTVFNWHSFLKSYSLEMLRVDADELTDDVTPDMIIKGWLGYTGASDEHITALEARLGTTLPPSYKAFLKISNGWSNLTPAIYRLLTTDEVAWLKDLNAPLIESWQATFEGEEEVVDMPETHLADTLQISANNDDALILLNPNVVNADGEWEAWFFAEWNPGADVYESFQALLEAKFESIKVYVRKEKQRYQSGDDVREKLPFLRNEMLERFNALRKTAGLDFGISDTALAVLHDVIQQIYPIQESATADLAMEKLRELQRDCALKAHEKPPHVETTEMLAVLAPHDTQEMLTHISKLAPDIHSHGKRQGYQQAIATINWFLQE